MLLLVKMILELKVYLWCICKQVFIGFCWFGLNIQLSLEIFSSESLFNQEDTCAAFCADDGEEWVRELMNNLASIRD